MLKANNSVQTKICTLLFCMLFYVSLLCGICLSACCILGYAEITG